MEAENNKKQGKSLSIKNLQSYSYNPFISELKELTCIEPRKKYGRDNREFTDLETGEQISVPVVTKDEFFFWKDSCPFLKIYINGDNLKEIANLSKPALWLFAFIGDNLKPNTDIILLSPSDFSNYSKNSNRVAYYQAIVELEEKGFIAKINTGAFYINVTKFINGVRTGLLGSPEDAYYEKHKRKI